MVRALAECENGHASFQQILPEVRAGFRELRDAVAAGAPPLAHRLAVAGSAAFETDEADPQAEEVLSMFVAIMVEVAAGDLSRGEALLRILTPLPGA